MRMQVIKWHCKKHLNFRFNSGGKRVSEMKFQMDRNVLIRQFVHEITIADILSPSHFWNWMTLLNRKESPNLAVSIQFYLQADSHLKMSDKQRFTLRQQIFTVLLEKWPEMLANWHEETECIVLLSLHNEISKDRLLKDI